jgi:ubiquinone/menaquinone biosynthesis C-methylase UbiE
MNHLTTPTPALVPNHHAHHPGFTGIRGVVAALSMAFGRDGDGRLAAQLTGVGPADRVVDVGCGSGAAVHQAALLGATVTGVDPTPLMLRLARVLGRGRGRVTFVTGTAESVPLPDRSATVAWSIASIHHWPDLDGGIAEVRRILEPGGRFVGLERRVAPGGTGLATHGWTDAQADAFSELLRAAGFVEVSVTRHTTERAEFQAVVGVRP